MRPSPCGLAQGLSTGRVALSRFSASLAKELGKVQTQLGNDTEKRQDKEKKAQAAKAEQHAGQGVSSCSQSQGAH